MAIGRSRSAGSHRMSHGHSFPFTLRCQSRGSIILLLCLLPFILFRKSYLPLVLSVVLVLEVLAAGLVERSFVASWV